MPGAPCDPSDLGPEFFTTALRGRYPGIEVAAAELVEQQEGTNTRARFRLTYRRGTGPGAVFVKAPGRLLHRLALSVLGALETEARLASSGVRLPLEHAELLAGVLLGGHRGSVVLLEDISARQASPNQPRTPLSPAEVESGLLELGSLHAAYLGRPLPAALSFVSPWRLAPFWAAVSLPSLAVARRRLQSLENGSWPAKVSLPVLERQFRQSARLARSGPQTLLHGDPHPGNSYRLAGDRTGFYDWQLIRRGHFAHDVSYFLAGSLTVADRRAHERRLLEVYLDALGSSGGRSPSFAETWERYRAGPAFGLSTWLHTLSAGSFQETADTLAMIDRFKAAYEDLGTAKAL